MFIFFLLAPTASKKSGVSITLIHSVKLKCGLQVGRVVICLGCPLCGVNNPFCTWPQVFKLRSLKLHNWVSTHFKMSCIFVIAYVHPVNKSWYRSKRIKGTVDSTEAQNQDKKVILTFESPETVHKELVQLYNKDPYLNINCNNVIPSTRHLHFVCIFG